jgi:hypothetical protein
MAMMKHLKSRTGLLLIATATSLGCGAIKDGVDDLATVGIGRDALSAVRIERSIDLGPARLPACLPVSITLPTSNISATLAPTNEGCTLTVRQPDLQLFDQQEIEQARRDIGDFDVDGVRSASVVVDQVQIAGADAAPLALSRFIDALAVQVDGAQLLDRTAPSAVEGDAELTRKLPSSLVQKLKASVKSNQPVTADVSITLWLRAEALTELPGMLDLLVVLQPQLEVNVVDATL